MKTFLTLVALIGLVVYLSFGTLSPCGISIALMIALGSIRTRCPASAAASRATIR